MIQRLLDQMKRAGVDPDTIARVSAIGRYHVGRGVFLPCFRVSFQDGRPAELWYSERGRAKRHEDSPALADETSRLVRVFQQELERRATRTGFVALAAAGCPALEIPVSTGDEASAAWLRYRDAHALAASDMGARCGHVYTAAGEFVAKVSYNGRVWDAQGKILLQEPAQ